MSSADEIAWNDLKNWAFEAVRSFPAVSTYRQIQDAMAKLTPTRRGLAGLWWTASEVWNGGFDQLYTNPCGYSAAEASGGFHLLGRSDFAEIVESSLAVFPDLETACLRDRCVDFLKSQREVYQLLDELGQQFWALERRQSFGHSEVRAKRAPKNEENCQ